MTANDITLPQTEHIVSDNTQDIYHRSNLTKLQILYWVGQKLRPDFCLFNSSLRFDLFGEVDSAAFAAAFHQAVQNSDAWRTVFREVEGTPQRFVLDEPPTPNEFLDFTQQIKEPPCLEEWIKQQLTHLLDITTCTYRSVLIRLAPDHFVWFLTAHHLIIDGTAVFLFYRQVMAHYAQWMGNHTVEIPPVFPFATYIESERAFRTSPRYPKAQAYWQQRLTSPVAPLKFYGRISHKHTPQVKRHTLPLSPDKLEKLRLAATSDAAATLTSQLGFSNLLLSLFFAQLHAISGSCALTVLVPFHNRPTHTMRNTIGLLMELCPVPVDIAEGETFVSLRQKVNREMQRVLLHYQYGSELALQNHSFEVAFNYVYRPNLTFNDAPVQQELLHTGYGSDTFGLHVHDFDGQHLILYFDFNENVFTPTEQEQTIQNFLHLLDLFLADPQAVIFRAPQHDLLSVEESQPVREQFVAPRDDLEKQLQHLWQEVIGVKPIGVRDNFFDLGGSSWLAMRLFAHIEKAMGQYLPLATLLQANTIEQLAQQLRPQTRKTISALVTIQKGLAGKRPFFCVPGAAGNSLVIARIAKFFTPDQPVYTFLMPGLMDGEIPQIEVESQATYYINIMRDVQPQGPYLLGGYSVGGVVAYEMAQQLQQQGEKVALLAIIDVPIQSMRLARWRTLIQKVGSRLGVSTEQQRSSFLLIRDTSFRLNYFVRRGFSEWLTQSRKKTRWFFRKLLTGKEIERGGPRRVEWEGQVFTYVPPPTKDADSSQLEDPRVKTLFELNDRAVRSYIPTPYTGRVALFKSAKGYSRVDLRSADPSLGWGEIARGGIEVHECPGAHLAMVSEPFVAILGQKLNNTIEKAQGELSGK